MKKFTVALAILTILLTYNALSQSKNRLPAINVKSVSGQTVNTSTFSNDGKPLVITFWATWCKPCLMELNTIHDLYEKWEKETGVKIIAVSVDDSRTARRVPSLVKSRGWKYEVYTDENGDFRRAMNVDSPPYVFLLDGEGKIVYEHSGYAPGDEKGLYEKIKQAAKK